MKGVTIRGLALGAGVAGLLGALHLLGIGLRLLLALALVLALTLLVVPRLGVRWFDEWVQWVRGRFWAREQGRFHSFGGVPLEIEDDGLHVWVGGDGLLRALGRREPDEVLAARHSGHWQRTAEGVLLLRVDAVVRYLATMPRRDEPRVQRLRRYFEREVLYPASRRRERPQV